MGTAAVLQLGGVQLLLILTTALAYTSTVVRHQPVGVLRLLLALPVILLLCAAPLKFEQVTVRGGLAFLLGWLSTFKLVAFACGRGPLAQHSQLDGLQFAALLLFPLYTAKRGQKSAKPLTVFLLYLVKLAFTTGLTALLLSPVAADRIWLKHFGYALYVWMFANLLLDAAVPAFGHLFGGIPLQVSMDAPYLSRSVQEFWGLRYNQIVSCTLTDVVYRPIMEGRLFAKPKPPAASANGDTTMANCSSTLQEHSSSKQASAASIPGAAPGISTSNPTHHTSSSRRMAAITASFAVSGFMHEVAVWYMCRRIHSSGKLMVFFLAQPLLMFTESALKARFLPPESSRSFLLRVAESAFALGSIMLLAHWFFWEPLEACNIQEQGLAEAAVPMRLLYERWKAMSS